MTYIFKHNANMRLKEILQEKNLNLNYARNRRGSWNEKYWRYPDHFTQKSNHEKINKLEEIEIIKAAASQNILNDIINSRNDPLYKILISVDN